jgi:hypothetical protein
MEVEPKFQNSEQCASHINSSLSNIDSKLTNLLQRDPRVERADTAKAVLTSLEDVKSTLQTIQIQEKAWQEGCYWVLYNGTLQIYRYARMLRKSRYAREAAKYLAYAMLTMESNVILLGSKYIHWRVTLYTELAEIYEVIGANKAASKVIAHAQKQLHNLKEIEEGKNPVPEGARDAIEDCTHILKSYEIKYGLLLSQIPPDQWKKRMEEFTDKSVKLKVALQSLNLLNDSCCRIVQQPGFKVPWKPLITSYIVDMVMQDIQTTCRGLQETEEKRNRDMNLLEVSARGVQAEREALLAKNREKDAQMIRENVWRSASRNAPLELHVTLIKYCYECKLWDLYFTLCELAQVRIVRRRIEKPYVNDVDVLFSSLPDSRIPKGYEKIESDLNIANFREELVRLGVSNPDGPPKSVRKPEEEKKLNSKAKGKPQQQKQANKPVLEEQKYELPEGLKHTFTYLILKYTEEDSEALSELSVALADDKSGPKIPEGTKAVGVPILQHGSVTEKVKKCNYIVTTPARDREDARLELITDVIPLVGRHPDILPPHGFVKIPVDFRRTPEEVEKAPNNTYVYIAYKTEKEAYCLIRDFKILSALRKLEQGRDTVETDRLSEEMKELGVKFEISYLRDLGKAISESTSGTIGDYYSTQSADLLIDTSFKIWNDFILPVLKLRCSTEERIKQAEISPNLTTLILEKWQEISSVFIEVLQVMFRVLASKVNSEDPITVVQIGLALASLEEEIGEVRHCVQILRTACSICVAARDDLLKRGVNAELDKDMPYSISADPITIKTIRKSLRNAVVQWEHQVAKALRDSLRKKELSEEEAKEEEWEVLRKLKEKERLQAEEAEKEGEKGMSEMESILISTHVDVLANLYRCELKLDRLRIAQNKTTKQTLKEKGLTLGIRNTADLAAKMNRTSTKVKRDTLELQQTLQEAGKLPPKKPTLTSTEKLLISENSKNYYQQALLYLTIAKFKSDPQEQKSLLKDALSFISDCERMEKQLTQLAIDNAPQLFASRLYEYSNNSSHLLAYPFQYLSDSLLSSSTICPPKPIIISRTSTSISVKLPYFRPKIFDKFNIKTIKHLALFGKEAKSGTNVTLTNYDLPGLNVKHEIDEVITVTDLLPNETYHFAAAGYTNEGECLGGIGETCESVVTLQPLPIMMLYAFVAESAYSLGHHVLAVKACENILSSYLNIDRMPHIMKSRFNTDILQSVSKIELRHIVYALVIYCKCMQKAEIDKEKMKLFRDPTYKPVLFLDKQYRELRLVNYLILALEGAVITRMPLLIKTCIHEAYNFYVAELDLKGRLNDSIHLLAKCYSSLHSIPNGLWDSKLRSMACLISYGLVSHSVKVCEYKIPTIINPTFNLRRFFLEVNFNGDSKHATISERETEGLALYEFLLTHNELQDIAKSISERYKESLTELSGKLTNQNGEPNDEQILTLKKYLEELSDIWTGLRTTNDGGAAKIWTVYKENSRIYEYGSKIFRYLLEKGTEPQVLLNLLGQVILPPLPNIDQSLQRKLSALYHDRPEKRLGAQISSDEEVVEYNNIPEDPVHHVKWASEWNLIIAQVHFLQTCMQNKRETEDRGAFFIRYMEVGNLNNEAQDMPSVVATILEKLSYAGMCASKLKLDGQLNNVARLLWNLLSCYMLPPSAFLAGNAWQYIVVISSYLLEMLENIKKKIVGETQNEITTDASVLEENSGVPWFTSISELDIDLYSNLIGFAIQCLLLAERWESLQYTCEKMNLVTDNHFSQTVLPFKIYAEKTLWEKAKELRDQRENDLRKRKEEFEHWMATSKRRKTRQAMLTGEIPQEQIDYERDAQEISESIAKRKLKEDGLAQKLSLSETQLENLKKGANKAAESLYQSRKLMEQYGWEARALQLEPQGNASRVKKRAHKVYANMVLATYRKTVELLRRRQEKWLLIQALHELGNLCFSEGLVEEAETSWSDAVDTVFQSIYIIRDFRQTLNLSDNSDLRPDTNLSDKYGVKECLLASIILYKLSSLIYQSKNLSRQKDCLLLGRMLITSPFRLSLPHPQHPSMHRSYRALELTPKFDLNKVGSEVPIPELAMAAEHIGVELVDKDCLVESLDVMSMMEMIGCEYLWCNSIAIKARLYKAIVAVKLGYIDTAFELLQKVSLMKDLPNPIVRKHIGREREHSFWSSKIHFNESYPPEHPNNNEAIQAILKLEFYSNSIEKTSLYCIELAQYAKALLLQKLSTIESIEDQQAETQRVAFNTEAEKISRSLLRNLAFEEELARLKAEYTGGEGDSLADYLRANSSYIDFTEISLKEAIINYIDLTEEGLSAGDIKVRRLELMIKTRELISDLKISQGDLTTANKVIRVAMMNICAYTEGKFLPENSTEIPTVIKAVNLEESKRDSAPAKKGAKELPKAQRLTDSERQAKEENLLRFLGSWEYRNIPGPASLLRLKLKYIWILYNQARYSEAISYLDSLKEECFNVKDTYYYRQALEIEAYIATKEGRIDESIEIFEKMKTAGNQAYESDLQFAVALGNYCELLVQRTHYREGIEIINEAREMMWKLMQKAGMTITNPDMNEVIKDLELLKLEQEEVKVDPKALKKEEVKVERKRIEDIKQLVPASSEKDTNSSKGRLNLYSTGLEQILQIEILRCRSILQLNPEPEMLLEVIECIKTCFLILERVFRSIPTHKYHLKLLHARAYRLLFIKSVLTFQSSYRNRKSSSKRDKKLLERIPVDELASGRTLLHLPNYSQYLTEEWIPYLKQSHACLIEAISIANKEALTLEPYILLFEMYKISILMREYRPRVGFKYLPNPSTGESGADKSYEQLLAEEQLDINRLTKDAIKALQTAKDLKQGYITLIQQYNTLSSINLGDVSKIPRLITQEILESDYIQKKSYDPSLFDESRKKQQIVGIDLITYFLKNTFEIRLFSIHREYRQRMLLKLHRYLLTVSPPYATLHKWTFDPSVMGTDPNEDVGGKGMVQGMWDTVRIQNEDVKILYYLTGPLDMEGLKKNPIPDDEENYIDYSKKDQFSYGELKVNSNTLVKIAQGLRDLRDKLKRSSGQPADKLTRDLKYLTVELKSYITQVGYLFDESLSKESEEEYDIKKDKFNNTITLLLPQVTDENLSFMASVLGNDGFGFKQANISGLMRHFHSLKY